MLLTLNGLYLGAAHRASPALFWTLDVSQFVLVPLLSLWALWSFAGITPRDYGLSRLLGNESRRLYALALLVSIFGYGAASAAAKFVPELWGSSGFSYVDALPLNPAGALLVLAYLCFSAALVEEIVFRALPLLFLSARSYPLVSALAFCAIHWENGSRELLATFLFGLAVAILYARLKNLWPFVIGHALADVLAFTGYYGG